MGISLLDRGLSLFGDIFTVAQTFLDDVALELGTGGTVSILYETQDANANALLIQLPAGGATDVPVIAIGQSISTVDLGLYNGVTEPRLALFGVGAVTTAPVWEFRKARGTIAAPTAITTGDDLGSINAYACVANGEYVKAASIVFDSSGTIATTRVGGQIEFWTTTDAAPSVLTQRGYIDRTGALQWGVGTANFGSLGWSTTMSAQADGAIIRSWQTNDTYLMFQAYDNTVGNVELMRVQAAADPYIRIGRDDTGVALNAVTDMLILQAGAGAGNEAAGFGFGLCINLGNAASEVEERARIAFTLNTATNGAEDASFVLSAMVAGAAPTTIFAGGGYAGVQKMGFFAATPVAKQTGFAALNAAYTTGDLDSEAEIIAALNTTNAALNVARTLLINYGLSTTV